MKRSLREKGVDVSTDATAPRALLESLCAQHGVKARRASRVSRDYDQLADPHQ